MIIIKFLEKILLLFEGRLSKIEYESEWYKIEGIDFIFLAVVIDIFEEVLFVAELGMVLEMIERLSEDAVVDTVLIFETFVGLLPAEIYKHLFWVLGLDPTCSGQHDSFY